ncbi:hypothetical protein TTHERM_00394620 (macronuclear) [Tetrahymena thermophila SB210]|uniref:Uncharacterized protein n=1 Tax=Tetrahymena thermophila (strain SB210) TaxID=312017 RepID=Q232Z1_TETTS|nr:hypothetical protein TTHERM_00394620 [Tetrahymena thermophila SB210]EAR91689.2 hypothetical protein TTHERM_00394620 [Tetrahymena thermophila SB210]|eukprot:XP_001011934.2 hypothetical protein TTHERM_00394620 [Tetrahymena thermophila SB210]
MQLMQAQGMQLYQTAAQNNTMTPHNGFQYLLQGYNNLQQLQTAQQPAIMSQPQMQQSTQQQQQYLALYLQQQLQQQRQMMIPQQQYQMMYQLNQQPQINSCFNAQINQNQHLLPTQQSQTQIPNMMYNVQSTFNYPMYVQPIISQSNTAQIQYMPVTNRTESTQNVAKPFDNLTNLNLNIINNGNNVLDQISLIQKENLQNLNISKAFLNQIQTENSSNNNITSILGQENQLQSLNSEKTFNKENVQTLLKENIVLSQTYSLIQKTCQVSMQNDCDELAKPSKATFNNYSENQNLQLSKESNSAKSFSNKNPKRGFRLTNNESKTHQIQQFSPSLSDSPLEAEREKLKGRNPPLISKPIKKMSKDGLFTEDKNSQQSDNLNFQYIKIQKIDSINFNLDESRSKSDTKVLIDNSIKYNFFKDSINIENTNQQQSDNSQDQLNLNKISHKKNQNSETNLLNLVNVKEVSNSKMDETHASVEQSVESIQKDEKEMQMTEIDQNHSSKQNLNQFEANEEKETVNANENKIDIEMFDNIFSHDSEHNLKIQSCSQSQYSPEKNNSESQEHESQHTNDAEKETPKKQLRRKLRVLKQKKFKNLGRKNKEINSEPILKKITKNKEDSFKCPSNIKLENVLPTKTRKQTQKIYKSCETQYKEQAQETQQQQKEIDNVDTFQEATQNIMNQFEKYNIKNLKRDEDLISEFKTFMNNARKNDEYISQLLNPVECDFSDNFIEFLRGPAIKWIKKNVEQSKQGVYYQLINLFKSEDRSSSSLRPRKTRSAYQHYF